MSFAITSVVIMGVSLIAGVTSQVAASQKAKKREEEASEKKRQSERKLKALEANRQEVINPYDTVKDLSGDFSNPMANLGVATQAAEIQMQQSDAALANTLDTLRSTGAGAGGATALAKAALQSKKDIAANIEKQEMANQKLAAQGEVNLQIQTAAEKNRVQQARAKGELFVYSENEERQMGALDRAQADINQADADFRQARADKDAADQEAIDNTGDALVAYSATLDNEFGKDEL
jgi:hypothetical protein